MARAPLRGGEPLLRPDLAARLRRVRDAARRPRRDRAPRHAPARASTSTPCAPAPLRRARAGDGTDPVIHEMVVRHELQHTETMRQAMELGGLLPAGRAARLRPVARARRRVGDRPRPARSSWAPATTGFAYDNERPRHAVDVAAFRIARRPVTNGTWMHFAEGGGYERREWWSDEGWAWKEEYDITHDPGVAAAGTPTPPRATSPGSRPTPSPARTVPASPPRPSGRRRRPGTRGPTARRRRCSRASARCGSGRRPSSAATRVRRPPLPRVLRGLLRRRLPRPARRLVGHAPARRRPPRSATGTSPSAGRSSPACDWPAQEA